MSDIMHIAFDATIDEFVDVHMRQLRRSNAWHQQRRRSMISAGILASAMVIVVLDRLLGRTPGNDLVIAGVLGGFAGGLCGPLYDREVARRTREFLQQRYGARMPMRCEIELRSNCLWVRQDGVDTELSWTTAEAVEDTTDGVELRFHWGLVVARNRGFATPSDRESFIEQARALSLKSSSAT